MFCADARGATTGWTTGPPYQASPIVAARLKPCPPVSPQERCPSSSRAIDGCPGPALSRRPARFRGNATARSAAREMIANSRPSCSWPTRSLPHRNRCGGVVAPSWQFRRSLPTTFGAEPVEPPPQAAKISDGRRHNCSPETMAVAARNPTPTVAAPTVQRYGVHLRAAVRGRPSTAC